MVQSIAEDPAAGVATGERPLSVRIRHVQASSNLAPRHQKRSHPLRLLRSHKLRVSWPVAPRLGRKRLVLTPGREGFANPSPPRPKGKGER